MPGLFTENWQKKTDHELQKRPPWSLSRKNWNCPYNSPYWESGIYSRCFLTFERCSCMGVDFRSRSTICWGCSRELLIYSISVVLHGFLKCSAQQSCSSTKTTFRTVPQVALLGYQHTLKNVQLTWKCSANDGPCATSWRTLLHNNTSRPALVRWSIISWKVGRKMW